jgi:deoxyribonuclease V
VHYSEADGAPDSAVAAAVAFHRWPDAQPADAWTVHVDGVAPYVPGRFFERELPCLLELLQGHPLPEVVVVDGHVWLGPSQRPGLGWHLWDALEGQVAVIGVAKRPFREGGAIEICRGDSANPLHVTAIGIDPSTAAADILAMHGRHRIPTLLREVDQLCRAG